VLVTSHSAARSALEPLRAACRRDPSLRPLAANLERAVGQLAVAELLGARFAELAIEREAHIASLREAWAELEGAE
jgi:hypothetical protein